MNPLEPVKKKKNDEEEGANLMRRLEDLPLRVLSAMNPLEPVKKKKNDEEEGANLVRRLEDLPLMSIECDESPGAREEEDLEVE